MTELSGITKKRKTFGLFVFSIKQLDDGDAGQGDTSERRHPLRNPTAEWRVPDPGLGRKTAASLF
jgi:hypothetical protein